MAIYTLHSINFSKLDIHRDGELVATMEGKGSFFLRTRQWVATDNKSQTVTVGRSIDECIKNYAAIHGDDRIKEIPYTHGARATFKTIKEKE
jgi:hypothetical protein|nr:MAG TPA: hypothetical protein [Caudoviricetes sp.]